MCFSDRVKLNNKSLMTNSLPSKLVFMSESAGDGSVFRILYNARLGYPWPRQFVTLFSGFRLSGANKQSWGPRHEIWYIQYVSAILFPILRKIQGQRVREKCASALFPPETVLSLWAASCSNEVGDELAHSRASLQWERMGEARPQLTLITVRQADPAKSVLLFVTTTFRPHALHNELKGDLWIVSPSGAWDWIDPKKDGLLRMDLGWIPHWNHRHDHVWAGNSVTNWIV